MFNKIKGLFKMTSSPNELRGKIIESLKQVMVPNLKKDIVSLGFVQDLSIKGEKLVFVLELSAGSALFGDQIKNNCKLVIKGFKEITDVEIRMKAPAGTPPTRPAPTAPKPKAKVLQGVTHTIAVASGKGGVGKSTVTANLAIALQKSGATVGLLDCDIYGPSMPMMFNLRGKQPEQLPDQTINPIESYGIKIMSMGFLSEEDKPVVWRGPMVHNIIQQFLGQVRWGTLKWRTLFPQTKLFE